MYENRKVEKREKECNKLYHFSLVNLVQQPRDEVSWNAYLEVWSVKLLISVLFATLASLVVIA